MGLRRFHLRGLRKVNTEFTLVAMAHKKGLTKKGQPLFLAALAVGLNFYFLNNNYYPFR